MKLLRVALTTLLFLMVAGTALAAGRLEPGSWPGAELAKSGPVAVQNQILKTTAGITLTAASPTFTGSGTVTVGSSTFTIGVDAFATIQAAIDAVDPGGTVWVLPGSYSEAAAGRFLYNGAGPYQFGIFVGVAKPYLTIMGVDGSGNPITSWAGVLSMVDTEARNTFGTSGFFIEGDHCTITGIGVGVNDIDPQKTIEVIGEDFTIKWCDLADVWGGVIYINDYRFNSGTNTSYVTSYHVEGNNFQEGMDFQAASGAGYSGSIAGRVVTGNTFKMTPGQNWASITFNGTGGVGWFIYPVGGAIITGNFFDNTDPTGQHIKARGDYLNAQMDWASYWNDNTFNKAACEGVAPPGNLRAYDYSVYTNARRIGAVIQDQVGQALASDIVLVKAGLYDERLTISNSMTLRGATSGGSKRGYTVPPAYVYDTATESVIRPSADLDRAVVHVAADGVVFDGFVVANEVCEAGSAYRDLVAIDQYLAAPTGVQILNCVLGPNTNTASQDGTKGRSGVTVYGPHGFPIKLVVMHNKIFDSKGNGCGIMIVGPYGPSYPPTTPEENYFAGSVIEDNDILGNHRTGIELAGGVQGGTAWGDHVIIRNNLISGNGWFSLAEKENLKYGHGVMFIRAGSDRAFSDAAGSRYVRLEDNVIRDNEKSGLYVGPRNSDLFGTGNVIQDNGKGTGGYSLWDGVRVNLDELYYAPGTTYTDYGFLANVSFGKSSILGNGAMGVRVMQTPSAGPVDAGASWWGIATPAGVAAQVSANVDYTPWLAVGTEDLVHGADPGFQGDFRTLWVDDNSPQTPGATRINEAVALVSGSTVNVAAGSYTERVDINNALSLLGPNAGIDPVTGTRVDEAIIHTDDLNIHQAVLIQASDVTVDGFTLYGPNGSVKDIGAIGLSGSGPRTNVHVQYNRVFRTAGGVDWNADGIRMDPPSAAAASVSVEHNRIEVGGLLTELNKGNNGLTWADHAYRLANGAGWAVGSPDRVVIRNNTLLGHSKMYLEGIGMLVDGNTFNGWWGPVEVRGAKDVIITGNQMTGQTDIGVYAWSPLSASGAGVCTDLVVSANIITGMQLDVQNFTDMGSGVVLGGVTNALVTGNTISGSAGSGVVVGGINYDHFAPESDLNWGGGLKTGSDPVNNVIEHNVISGNVTGLLNRTALSMQATCNWWGNLLGPNVPPGNPSPGDGITGPATYAPWWTTASGPCDGYGENYVAPVPPATCITPVNACVQVPVDFTRADLTPMRGYSVTLTLSSNLSLCGAGIVEGSYLSNFGSTNFGPVLSLGSGVYTVDCAILGGSTGATGSGTLFTLNLAGAVTGTGTVTVNSVTARDMLNAPLAGIPGPPASITIDNTAPVAIADLLAAQVKTGNDPDGTTKIHLSFTAPSDAAQVHLYRAGWGNYPEYDDVGGGVPVWPSGSWTLAATLTAPVAAYDDEVAWPARDFWYYVAVVEDACGNLSAVSNQTAGTLNYHLGDVHNGVANCAGDNLVNLLNDIGYLGSNYGVTLGYPDARACLDVGPTTDYSVNARPTTDNRINFEDLMMFAINYGQVSAPQAALQPVAVASDELSLEGPAQVSVGATFTVSLRLKGAGDLQGLSAQLGWDRAVAEPVAVEAGGLATTQNGVVFSSGAGNVDAALLGANRGFMGEGVLATVTFRALASGAPAVALAKLDARTLGNQPVALAGVKAPVPTATQFAPAMPNPFRGTTTLSYALAQGGVVELAVYSVDGRKVATLASGVQEAGAYRLSWDGAGARPGLYYARLTTPQGKFTRTLVLTR